MSNYRPIHVQIKNLRVKKKIPVNKLWETTGVNKSVIIRFENGMNPNISLSNFVKICHGIGITDKDLNLLDHD